MRYYISHESDYGTLLLQILPSLKPALSEMIRSYYKHLSVNQTLNADVMSDITAATMQELTAAHRKVGVHVVCLHRVVSGLRFIVKPLGNWCLDS